MNRYSKKEIRGKRSKFYLLELSINPRRPIGDHLQEEEEEEEVANEANSPRMTEMKKIKNLLTRRR